MKNFMMIAAVAAVALTSCVKNDGAIELEQEIAFSTVAQKPTKAVNYGPITGTTYPEDEHFGVYSYLTATDWATDKATAPVYMDNVEITKTGTYWSNATTKYYWPISGKLTFAAYSPFAFGTGTVSSECATGVAFAGFTATNNLAEQVDLCVTDLIKNQTKQTAVSTPFKHILSQVVFTVAPKEADMDVASIVVNSITVKAVKTVGNYASTDGSWTAGAWSDQATTVDYSILTSAATLDLASTTAVAAGTSVIVIPQACAGYAIDINYTVNYTATVTATTVKTFNIAASSNWEKGKKYAYNIQIGLDEILFNPTIENWEDATGANIDVNTL